MNVLLLISTVKIQQERRCLEQVSVKRELLSLNKEKWAVMCAANYNKILIASCTACIHSCFRVLNCPATTLGW